MARNMQHDANILQEEIRRQFGSAGMSRFMRALPGFQVEQRIPDRLANLLSELDRVETDRGMPDYAGRQVSPLDQSSFRNDGLITGVRSRNCLPGVDRRFLGDPPTIDRQAALRSSRIRISP